MHTWGQTIQEHLHIHFIVTGGALVTTPEGYRWQAAEREYLFAVKLLSNQFRNRFCYAVMEQWVEGKLNTREGEMDVAGMVQEGLSKDWEVYIQSPLYGPEKLLEYLGRYVFRIAISNHRIVAIGKETVTFKYFDNRDGGKEKLMTLAAVEFMRRFLTHVLPDGFVRVRHYGLHHSSCRGKLQEARRRLGLAAELPVIAKLKMMEWIKEITGSQEDPRLCKYCGKGLMVPVMEFGPVYGWRLMVHMALVWLTTWRLART
jgi:hypothetical protein